MGKCTRTITLYKNINSIEKGTCKIINHSGIEKDVVYADIKNEIINSKKITFSDKNESKLYLKK